jgi:hypothetical protein
MIYLGFHFENISGIVLIYMLFHKFKHRHEKHALEFGNSIFYSNHKNNVMLILRIEKKNRYMSTRHFENCSGFILITMAFHKFSRCKAIHM